jgi:hypothetical protein
VLALQAAQGQQVAQATIGGELQVGVVDCLTCFK